MKILALDPSISLLKLLSDNLGQYNYEFQGAIDVEIGYKALQMGYQPEIIMVNICFCAHPTLSQLESFFSLLNYPYRAIVAIINTDDESSRSHAINMGFHAVIAKPLNLKQVLTEIESIAGVSAEQFTFLPVSQYTRREVRLPIAVGVTLKIVEENSDQYFLEHTVTEDISLNGAAVLTLFELKIGTVINIAPVNETEFCIAIVRRTVVSNDYIRRLNLEIIGKRWQDFYNELTQIHVNEETATEDTPSHEIAVEEISDEDTPSQEILVEEISDEEISDEDTPSHEIPIEEIESLSVEAPNHEIVNNRYRIEREIGKGGLGVVYQATDLISEKRVALKFLLDDQAKEDLTTNQKYFEREIKILSEIQHPNIVSILDSGFSNNRPFFVMDYVEGKSVEELLREEKTWPVPRVLNLLQQLCPALYAMHSKNIVHRDLKPGNIMIEKIGDSERAILLDLGIAKMVSGSNENSLMKEITKTGTIVGTLGYTSPEQCLDAELDDGVDIYSLGIIVYQLLTGEMPFNGNTMAELILAHVQGKPTLLRQVNPNISNAIESVVLWAIAKNRSQRPKNIMEFLQHFESATKDLESVANPFESTAKSLEPTSTPFEPAAKQQSKAITKALEPTVKFLEPSVNFLESVAKSFESTTNPFESIGEAFEPITESFESIAESAVSQTENKDKPLEDNNHISFFFPQD